MNMLKDILVATDFGEASNTALLYGREFARRFGARLHVIHVVDLLVAHVGASEGFITNLQELQEDDETQAERDLQALLSEEDRQVLRARTAVTTSSTPAEAIVEYAKAENIGLIVLGTHGRQAMARLLVGSVAERVVRRAPCPVLTVRHPEHEFILPDALQVVTHA
jgi:nucleotide-binding universal stress UspA family protein